MLYLALLTVLATTYGSPLPGQLFYYPQQYVKAGLLPYVHYQVPSALKALQTVNNPNELVYYPGLPVVNPQNELVRTQQGVVTPAATARFTAPPQGLVDAIYAWFAENNLPVPGEPSKNEISTQDEKPQATEADVLAEADRNPTPDLPKKPIQPVKPGQRFFILNGEPQFVGVQQVYNPQSSVVMRSALPEDPNLILYQPQTELQQNNLKVRNFGIGVQNQEVYSQPGGFYFLKSGLQQLQQPKQRQENQFRPVRYHGVPQAPTDQVKNQEIPVPVMEAQNYPQHLFVGRLLPQGNEHQQINQPQLIYHQFLAPFSVVPPQENQVYNLPQYNQQQAEVIPQIPQQPYIQIPVNNDVQIPHYIKGVVPINTQVNTAKEDKQEVQSRFASQDIQPSGQPEEVKTDTSADLAALDFVRYLENKQNADQFSDSVVIDAKTEEQNKEDNESEDVQADDVSDPTVAQAEPAGIALAGPGGIAATAPKGTALAGEKGLAISSPRATAVAGPNTNKEDSKPVKKS